MSYSGQGTAGGQDLKWDGLAQVWGPDSTAANSQLIWVYKDTPVPVPSQDGSMAAPYSTLGAAMAAIAATPLLTLEDQQRVYTVMVISGSASPAPGISPTIYDEDLTIPSGRQVLLVATGAVQLGGGAGFVGNVSFAINNAFGAQSVLAFAGFVRGPTWQIMGALVLSDSAAAALGSVSIADTTIAGAIDATAVANGASACAIAIDGSSVNGAISGPALPRTDLALHDCTIGGDINCKELRAENVTFGGSTFTVTSVTTATFLDCNWTLGSPAWTGNSVMRCDGASWYSWQQRSGTFPAAPPFLLERIDLPFTPSDTIAPAAGPLPTSITITPPANVIFVATNPGPGQFTVNLPAAPQTGEECTVKDATGNAAALPIIVAGLGGYNIDGMASQSIAANYGSMLVKFNGAEWSIL